MLKTINLILIFVIVVMLLGAGFYWFNIRTFESGTQTRIDSAILQSEIREIAELSTVVYIYQGIASIDEYAAGRLFGLEWRWPGTTRSMLIRYDGEVRFGIDFDRIIIDVDNITNKITVIMPPARIMTHTPNLHSIQVFDDSAGLFVSRNATDTTDTIANAMDEKEKWLIDNGILEQANANAENLIQRFIETFVSQHDADYEIIFR